MCVIKSKPNSIAIQSNIHFNSSKFNENQLNWIIKTREIETNRVKSKPNAIEFNSIQQFQVVKIKWNEIELNYQRVE